MITLAQLTEMLDMQEALEIRIDGPAWREKGHDYRLCIHMECAEIIDHMGWKHWKNIDAEPDWDAIAMELVDVWHFGMAHWLTGADTISVADTIHKSITVIQEEYDPEEDDTSVSNRCISISVNMYTCGQFMLDDFVSLMEMASMSWNDLYKLYVGKNILNWFRQDHGYKEGLYMKNWAGKEDNLHLFEITEMLGDNFDSVELVKCLTARYALAGH